MQYILLFTNAHDYCGALCHVSPTIVAHEIFADLLIMRIEVGCTFIINTQGNF